MFSEDSVRVVTFTYAWRMFLQSEHFSTQGELKSVKSIQVPAGKCNKTSEACMWNVAFVFDEVVPFLRQFFVHSVWLHPGPQYLISFVFD